VPECWQSRPSNLDHGCSEEARCEITGFNVRSHRDHLCDLVVLQVRLEVVRDLSDGSNWQCRWLPLIIVRWYTTAANHGTGTERYEPEGRS
jgi:hypothetical protein